MALSNKRSSKGLQNLLAAERNNFKPVASQFDLTLVEILHNKSQNEMEQWKEQQKADGKRKFRQYYPAPTPTVTITTPIKNKKTKNNNHAIHPQNLCEHFPVFNETICDDADNNLETLSSGIQNLECDEFENVLEPAIIDVDSTSTKIVKIGLHYFVGCEKSYSEMFLSLVTVVHACNEITKEQLPSFISKTFDDMFTQCYLWSKDNCMFTLNGNRLISLDQLDTEELKRDYSSAIKKLERGAKLRTEEVRATFYSILNSSKDITKSVLKCSSGPVSEAYGILFDHVKLQNLNESSIRDISRGCHTSVQLYNSSAHQYETFSVRRNQRLLVVSETAENSVVVKETADEEVTELCDALLSETAAEAVSVGLVVENSVVVKETADEEVTELCDALLSETTAEAVSVGLVVENSVVVKETADEEVTELCDALLSETAAEAVSVGLVVENSVVVEETADEEVTELCDALLSETAAEAVSVGLVVENSVVVEETADEEVTELCDSLLSGTDVAETVKASAGPRKSTRTTVLSMPLHAYREKKTATLGLQEYMQRNAALTTAKTTVLKSRVSRVPDVHVPSIPAAQPLIHSDVDERLLMEVARNDLRDPMFFVKQYTATEYFTTNDVPYNWLNSELKHYIYPLVFCSPPVPNVDRPDESSMENASFAKQIPLCRYINRICTAVTQELVKSAHFVVENNTVVDKNGVFSGIVNNEVNEDHPCDDGKRQSTSINLKDDKYEELRNLFANVKNLIIYTGAVPINCFPTSGNGNEDTVTLILQLSGALVQHFHYDFDYDDFLPRRGSKVGNFGDHFKFHGCSLFFNFSFEIQTIDLPDIDCETGGFEKRVNYPMSIMIMKGSQRHAGSPNPTSQCTAKFFMYIRKPNDGSEPVYHHIQSVSIAVPDSAHDARVEESEKIDKNEPFLYYNRNCSRYFSLNE